jgi:hypothetical protein
LTKKRDLRPRSKESGVPLKVSKSVAFWAEKTKMSQLPPLEMVA